MNLDATLPRGGPAHSARHVIAWARSSKHLTISFGLVAALLGVLASLTAGSAAAAGPTITKSVPLNWCPSGAAVCGDKFTAPAPWQVTSTSRVDRVVCSVNARVVEGSSRWFFVGTSTGVGFLRNSALANPPAGLPDCSRVPGVEASLWTTAAAQYNVRKVGDDARTLAVQGYRGSEWTTTQWWSGYCIMFAELAWQHTGNHIKETGNASDVWRQVAKWGKPKDLNPPRGALVFWSWGSEGHAAISLGNGTVMTTVGAPNDKQHPATAIRTIADVSGPPGAWYAKTYLGWWLPRPY